MGELSPQSIPVALPLYIQTLQLLLDAIIERDRAISTASHEIKTPLTVLKLQTQLLQKRLEKQGLHDFLTPFAKIEAQIHKLERLTRELLDDAQSQTDRLEYHNKFLDLNKLLRECAEVVQHLYLTHQVIIHGTAKACLVGDKHRLEQVFTNLLSNAIKYSPASDTVELEVSSSKETITVRVRDHGIGIPREHQEKIFERFYRIVDPERRTIPGLGVGLSIVADIIKQYGGKITVESEQGKGSTFHLVLPAAQSDVPCWDRTLATYDGRF